MALVTFELQVEVDREALREHVAKSDGERPPYMIDVSEWDATDIQAAQEEEIISLSDATLIFVGESEAD